MIMAVLRDLMQRDYARARRDAVKRTQRVCKVRKVTRPRVDAEIPVRHTGFMRDYAA
jgi:hypothetical protein